MRRVSPNVLRLESGGVGPFLVEADGLVLVDTGLPRRSESILDELGGQAAEVVAIVLTHGHPDHIGNAAELAAATGAEVVAGEGERGLLDGSGWDSLSLVPRMIRGLVRPPRSTVVDRWVTEGDVVAGVRVIPTPGHSPGHISLMAGGTLLCGDSLVTGDHPRESPRLLTADRSEARRSIIRMAEIGAEVAVSAHGRPMFGATRELHHLASSFSRPRP